MVQWLERLETKSPNIFLALLYIFGGILLYKVFTSIA